MSPLQSKKSAVLETEEKLTFTEFAGRRSKRQTSQVDSEKKEPSEQQENEVYNPAVLVVKREEADSPDKEFALKDVVLSCSPELTQ